MTPESMPRSVTALHSNSYPDTLAVQLWSRVDDETKWVCVLLMKFIEDYCVAYVGNSRLYGQSVRRLFNSVSIYIMPMVNPDGVDLVTDSLSKSSSGYLNALDISNQFPTIPFPSRLEV